MLNTNYFISGFNAGYLLAKYEPKLLVMILKGLQRKNPFIVGLHAGQNEFEVEQEKGKLDELRKSRQFGRRKEDPERD